MNGTLRGLPALNEVHIPPLRNPAPSINTHAQAPSPLKLIDQNSMNDGDRMHCAPPAYDDVSRHRSAHSAPVEPSPAKEVKKPLLAISELVDSPTESDTTQVQLPSFVSLSVVEKSPTQTQLDLNNDYPHKRPRLDTDPDLSLHDMNRLLPRPVQKDDKQVIPLLPAMVTGLHEPPPSAALLPSINPDARPAMQRSSTSKMQVKDMLLKTERLSNGRPPEQMLNTPEVTAAELPRLVDSEVASIDIDTPSTTTSVTPAMQLPRKDPKIRRTRRKWTEAETRDLLAGVRKHGFGKWKQILNDSSYVFIDRTSIDLKDRFRVFAKDFPDGQAEGTNSDDAPAEGTEYGQNGNSNKSTGGNGPVNKQRRKRHPWTPEEDSALLQGVQKYGFQWTDIHNDNDLGLVHRRATDLRDRIRNLYPDGYKHAEARPLRAEVKKAEKAGKKETPAGTLYAPPNQMDSINFAATTNAVGSPQRSVNRRQTTSGKVPSIATLTRSLEEDDHAYGSRPVPRRSKTIAEPSEHIGITLPSLTRDNASDSNYWDNTLPPFMGWDNEI